MTSKTPKNIYEISNKKKTREKVDIIVPWQGRCGGPARFRFLYRLRSLFLSRSRARLVNRLRNTNPWDDGTLRYSVYYIWIYTRPATKLLSNIMICTRGRDYNDSSLSRVPFRSYRTNDHSSTHGDSRGISRLTPRYTELLRRHPSIFIAA